MELEESGSLTSGYTIKLQSSKEYDTGTKIEILINVTGQEKPEMNPCTYGQFMTKEARKHGIK